MSNGLHTQFGWITPPFPGLAPKANNEEEEKKREGGRGGERSKIQQSSQTHFLQGRGGGFHLHNLRPDTSENEIVECHYRCLTFCCVFCEAVNKP